MLLANYLQQIGADAELASIILDLAKASCELISRFDANSAVKINSSNQSGDTQIKLDILADELFTGALADNQAVNALSSEEQPDQIIVNSAAKYSVAFDPLDGSSLVDTNFSVGTIVGIYQTADLHKAGGQDLTAALYVIYGPRTILVAAVNNQVFAATLQGQEYYITKTDFHIATETKYFAPGNLRATQENTQYGQLVDYWLKNQYKLRYSGGMVPDLHHILYKGQGVFSYPGTAAQPEGKLRFLYECLPMAKIIETAGGASTDGQQSILKKSITSIHQSTPICVGSQTEVERYQQIMSST